MYIHSLVRCLFIFFLCSFMISNLYGFLLNQSTHNRKQKVPNHDCQKQVPQHSHNRFWLHIYIFRMVKGLFLFFEPFCQVLRKTLTKWGNPTQNDIKSLFPANRYHKQHLDVDFDNGFTNESGDEELSERNSKMTASNPCQVEQGIRYRSTQ